jgi:hypothetical protein
MCADTRVHCRSIALLDTRSPEVARICEAHNSVVNQVLWARSTDRGAEAASGGECGTPKPLSAAFGASAHLLLSTSLCPVINIFDARRTAQPWAVLEGHRHPIAGKGRGIVQADFAWGVPGRPTVTALSHRGVCRHCLDSRETQHSDQLQLGCKLCQQPCLTAGVVPVTRANRALPCMPLPWHSQHIHRGSETSTFAICVGIGETAACSGQHRSLHQGSCGSDCYACFLFPVSGSRVNVLAMLVEASLDTRSMMHDSHAYWDRK